jgi:hypothetical protein
VTVASTPRQGEETDPPSLLRPFVSRRNQGSDFPSYELAASRLGRISMAMMYVACGLGFAKMMFNTGPQTTLIVTGAAGVLAIRWMLSSRVRLTLRPEGLHYSSRGLDGLLTQWILTSMPPRGPTDVLLVEEGHVQTSWWSRPLWAVNAALGQSPEHILHLNVRLRAARDRSVAHELERILKSGSTREPGSNIEISTAA